MAPEPTAIGGLSSALTLLALVVKPSPAEHPATCPNGPFRFENSRGAKSSVLHLSEGQASRALGLNPQKWLSNRATPIWQPFKHGEKWTMESNGVPNFETHLLWPKTKGCAMHPPLPFASSSRGVLWIRLRPTFPNKVAKSSFEVAKSEVYFPLP